MKSRYLRSITGILLIAGAVLLAADMFNWWSYTTQQNGLIGLIIAAVCCLWIFLFGTNIINSLGYFASLGYIFYENGIINSDNRTNAVILLAMLSVALACIGSAAKSDKELDAFLRKPRISKKANFKKSTFGFPHHVKSSAETTEGAKLTARFGTLAVSFDDTHFTTDCEITVKAFFGKVRIRIPEGACPEVSADCAFGKTIVKLALDEDTDTNFILNSKVTFGRVIVMSCPSAMDNFRKKPFTCVYKDNQHIEEIVKLDEPKAIAESAPSIAAETVVNTAPAAKEIVQPVAEEAIEESVSEPSEPKEDVVQTVFDEAPSQSADDDNETLEEADDEEKADTSEQDSSK